LTHWSRRGRQLRRTSDPEWYRVTSAASANHAQVEVAMSAAFRHRRGVFDCGAQRAQQRAGDEPAIAGDQPAAGADLREGEFVAAFSAPIVSAMQRHRVLLRSLDSDPDCWLAEGRDWMRNPHTQTRAWRTVSAGTVLAMPRLVADDTYQSQEVLMINLILWLVVGGVLGWIASMITGTDAQQGIFLNVIVGIVGAALAGLVISPLLGVPTINQNAFSIGALLISLVGAIVLLAIVNLFRRGRVR